jgi:hypothetical protein
MFSSLNVEPLGYSLASGMVFCFKVSLQKDSTKCWEEELSSAVGRKEDIGSHLAHYFVTAFRLNIRKTHVASSEG